MRPLDSRTDATFRSTAAIPCSLVCKEAVKTVLSIPEMIDDWPSDCRRNSIDSLNRLRALDSSIRDTAAGDGCDESPPFIRETMSSSVPAAERALLAMGTQMASKDAVEDGSMTGRVCRPTQREECLCRRIQCRATGGDFKWEGIRKEPRSIAKLRLLVSNHLSKL